MHYRDLTNKLMQVSYHFALIKIQKLKNLKKKKKTFFCTIRYCPKLAGTWPVFKPVRNVDVLIPVHIPAGMASTGTVLTTFA